MTITPQTSPKDILTVPEVAEYLRFSVGYTYALVKRGEIPAFRVGKSPRVRRADLERLIESKLVAVVAQ